MAGRKKNTNPTKRVDPTIPFGSYACLQFLVGKGRHGANVREVARYLIIRGLDELTREGILPAQLPTEPDKPNP